MKSLFIVICFVLTACDIPIGDRCDAEELAPYSEEILEGCSDKCCLWILLDFDTGVRCDEMWCFRDCHWSMMHETCYQT
jgi:hypothetical protein